MTLRRPLTLAAPLLLLLACQEEPGEKRSQPDTGTTTLDTDPDCDSGYLEDEGDCVPTACGSGIWGNLETDENTIHVDISAAEGGDGSEAAPFTSIQAGLDAAGDAGGGMVAVAGGTYPETLELDYGHDGVRLAGRCKELVIIDASVGGEETPGLHFSAGTAEVAVSGVTVSGSRHHGVLAVAGSLALEDAKVEGSGYVGIVAYQAMSVPTTLSLDSCEIARNTVIGLFANEPGTTVTLRETRILDTQPDEAGNYGFGIEAHGGATLELEACEISRNAQVGVLVYESGTTVSLREAAILDTQPNQGGQLGIGIDVYGGASLEAVSCELAGNSAAGVQAWDNDTVVCLQETAILDTQPDSDGAFGYGIYVSGGASLEAVSCQLAGNSAAGVQAWDADTTVSLQETAILDTQPDSDGALGYGINVYGGASLSARDCAISGNAEAGLRAQDRDTVVSLQETTIQGTLPDGDGEYGHGVYVFDEASLCAEACQLSGNRSVGILAETGAEVSLQGTTIQDTQPDEHEAGGFGMQVLTGARLEVESCVISGNTGVGVLVLDSDTSVSLRETTIQGTQIAASGNGGYGIEAYGGVSLEADSCSLSENASAGILALDSGTSVVLRETTLHGTRPDAFGDGGYGIQASNGASVSAEDCDLWENAALGVVATVSGTSVSLHRCAIRDTQPSGGEDYGYGIGAGSGASLTVTDCQVSGNTTAGVVAVDSGTQVTLRETAIRETRRGELYTVGMGLVVQAQAAVAATALELASNEGPGLYVVDRSTRVDCSRCRLQRNQFAGAVLVHGASLTLEGSLIEGTTAQENIGGGAGVFSEPWDGPPPTLAITDCTIQDNPIAGVWLSGQGSYAFTGNRIHGGEGWTRQSLTKCGDALYAREGVTAWDGSSGLLLQENELMDGLGAGLLLDDASATLIGNSYGSNAVDLVTQGADCATPPVGYEEEGLGSVELCPSYDYATCGDEFALFLALAEPESGHGAAFAKPGLLGPDALRLPLPPLAGTRLFPRQHQP